METWDKSGKHRRYKLLIQFKIPLRSKWQTNRNEGKEEEKERAGDRRTEGEGKKITTARSQSEKKKKREEEKKNEMKWEKNEMTRSMNHHPSGNQSSLILSSSNGMGTNLSKEMDRERSSGSQCGGTN
jgi:hypothetical protein